MSEYPPVEAHGLVGDLQTCALVNRRGTVDWCPFPGVESPSVFASILDAERGGHFRVAPEAAFDAEQSYVDQTTSCRRRLRPSGARYGSPTSWSPPKATSAQMANALSIGK